uniref:Uncharacterized protein n=1 Tax=Anopheles culicifacies TaxID=139723 RepID=A0A182LW23_9DIPT
MSNDADDYEQSELVYEVQTEEIVEEFVLTDKESFDYLYKTVPEIEQCIAKEPESVNENNICEVKNVADECYFLPETERCDEILLSDDQEHREIQDADEQEQSEEIGFNDPVEDLTDNGKEISPAFEESESFSKSISSTSVKDVMPKSCKNPSEVRRQQQREAAERRRIEQETRGIKDPDKVRRQQQRAMEQERREQEASRMGGQQPTLKFSSLFVRA